MLTIPLQAHQINELAGALDKACALKSLPLLKHLLDAGLDPNRPYREFLGADHGTRLRYPLQTAAALNWSAGIRTLIAGGARADAMATEQSLPILSLYLSPQSALSRFACIGQYVPATAKVLESPKLSVLADLLQAGARLDPTAPLREQVAKELPVNEVVRGLKLLAGRGHGEDDSVDPVIVLYLRLKDTRGAPGPYIKAIEACKRLPDHDPRATLDALTALLAENMSAETRAFLQMEHAQVVSLLLRPEPAATATRQRHRL